MKIPATAVIGAAAVVAAVVVFEAVRWQASRRSIDAGFWYGDGASALSWPILRQKFGR
jgi:hypothetical protein